MNNFLTFTKGERVAIIVLAAVIFILIAANFFIVRYPLNVNKSSHNLDSIMALHEKAVEEYYRQQATVNRQQTFIAENKVVKKPRRQSSESKVQSSEFKVQSSEFKVQSSEFKVQGSEFKVQSSEFKVQGSIGINSADTTELKSLPGIGSFFARNIVEYREKLGGYVESSQLLEVYGFDSVRFAGIFSYIKLDSVATRKVRVNHDDFKTILRHPYIEYDDVKKVVKYRESKGMIKDWESYKNIINRDPDDRLEMYLAF